MRPDIESILPLLVQIDLLPETATGAFLAGPTEKPAGVILIEHRQICWALAATLERRLTELIEQASAKMEPGMMQMVYDSCRISGKPLGEHLVALGIITPGKFRQILFQHTLEAVVAVSSIPSDSWKWVDHKRKGYNPEFTFSTQEVLQALQTLADADEAAPSRDIFKSVESSQKLTTASDS